MKKQYAILLGIILSTSFFLSSCRDKNTGDFQFDKIELNEIAHLFGDTARPACNLIINYTYISKSSDQRLMDSLNQVFLSTSLGERVEAATLQEAIDIYKENYVAEYRLDLESMYSEELKKTGSDAPAISSWYSYYKSIESEVKLYEKDLLVYKIYYTEYTGGAHGIYATTFLNYDLKNLHQLTLDDIFTGDYTEALTDLLWNQLIMQNKLTSREDLEDIGYGLTGELTPTENFYLDKDGITFFYNIYDFTPYVMGETEITLPYEVVSHLLGENPIISQLRK
ncbi:MAG: DUF3298 and DUF4163 domain-containing protein [Bacteroides sp.]|nr:DUF3298 and DUF4163 domain-containing protein [Bacteroides sp.]